MRDWLLFEMNQHGNRGFVNTEGILIIPYKWDDAKRFQEGFAIVEDDDGKYLINKKGKK